MNNNCLGKIAYSKAGRDQGKVFVVVSVLDDEYVYVCDGSLRPVEKPKKKKVKHLEFTNIIAEEIESLLMSDEKVTNAVIKRILQSYDNNREVRLPYVKR
ncbi:KOW domain-containing RNA-binding protein [Clostridium aciditolerans]|uniref:KOW domain-containing RNA-binding protein n=1 Tax=Clostridium aciditolerans TaxID=339861 RepID=A0A934HZU2_9CLOT|nr:KOW domain-containing RNA-binding protein [Clostridium aciditolerans]MBI6874224.1 KOW domain-containing RNA-binding protein [Clostridium aciditolerans]